MWMQTIFTFLLGVVTGGFGVAGLLWYVLSFFFHDPDDKKRLLGGGSDGAQALPPQHATSATFQLPPILLSKISDESCKAKESCWAVNFILYFLFRELKNSESVRRWVLRKLAMEFDELLSTSVLGKFFSNITIQNIDLGENFPVVNWLRTVKVELHPVFKSIATLDILVDLDYAGGFQFSIQAESHLKHSAFLSVQFNEVKGQARLQFASEPYPHWSFSFMQNPEIDISVVSQLYGKSFNQVTSIIAAQLKRSVRKKHTLPMYKIRYKPFFNRIQPLVAACVPNAAPRIETTGTLIITIVECRGLMQSLLRGNVYARLGIANFDWVAAYESSPKHFYVVRDVCYVKTAKREAKLDFRLTQQGDVPVVESVESAISVPRAIRKVMNMISFSPTECVLEPGDEIVSVDWKRVSTIKQCVKHFRNSSSVRVIWRIRRKYPNGDVEEPQGGGDEEEVPEDHPGPSSSLHTDGSQSQNSSRRNSYAEEAAETVPIRTQGISNERIDQLYKTNPLPACRDPIFQDAFPFTLDEAHQFINISCWSGDHPGSSDESSASSPSSSPIKRTRVVPPTAHSLPFGRDSLLGTLCIPLGDVVSECSTTGMGFFVKDFYFGPPDGNNAVEARESELRNHSGFEPRMCYGKVTLSFQFKPTDDSKRKTSVESTSNATGAIHLDLGNSEPVLVEQSQLSPSEEPQSHRFVRTHFKSSAVCDYCNKKIWLKEAHVCANCGMRCHKKCNERCVANTICPPPIVPSSTSTSGSKSLPPSPDASPATSRKTSVTTQVHSSTGRRIGTNSRNPFELLDPTGSGLLSQEDFDVTVECLIQRQGEDLVSLAKDSGRELYANQSLKERKEKLHFMLTRLQAEIDSLSLERGNWTREEAVQMTARADDRVQALTLLMLHCCAGLQNVQDLEELGKEGDPDIPPVPTADSPVSHDSSPVNPIPRATIDLTTTIPNPTFHISS